MVFANRPAPQKGKKKNDFLAKKRGGRQILQILKEKKKRGEKKEKNECFVNKESLWE